MNEPNMPVSRMRISVRNVLGLYGSGKCPNVYTRHSGTTSSVSSMSGRLMPSRPKMNRLLMTSIHDLSTRNWSSPALS